MSLHESITVEMQRYIQSRDDCATLSPAALASAAYSAFANAAVEPHVQYGCLEHFKSVARRVLAGRFADDGDSNAAYTEHGELFSGHLQERYPIPRARGDDPVYKLRHLLTPDERAWNVKRMRKSGEARLSHADALEAEALVPEAAL